MMIGDDDVDGECSCVCNFLVRRDPGIDGDDERYVFFLQQIDAFLPHAIAFFHAIRQMHYGCHMMPLEESHELRRRRNAVTVVVSKDGDGFFFLHPSFNTVHCFLHLRKQKGVEELRSRIVTDPTIATQNVHDRCIVRFRTMDLPEFAGEGEKASGQWLVVSLLAKVFIIRAASCVSATVL